MATGENFAQGGYISVVSGKSSETVLVRDLFAVFPELAGHEESAAEFADHVKRAAELSRSEDSLIGLRDRFHQAAHDELEHTHYTGPTGIVNGDDDAA